MVVLFGSSFMFCKNKINVVIPKLFLATSKIICNAMPLRCYLLCSQTWLQLQSLHLFTCCSAVLNSILKPYAGLNNFWLFSVKFVLFVSLLLQTLLYLCLHHLHSVILNIWIDKTRSEFYFCHKVEFSTSI